MGDVSSDDTKTFNIINIWTSQAAQEKTVFEKKGYLVRSDVGVLDKEIRTHLGDPDTHGYIFIGHGASGATINSFSHLGEDRTGVEYDRYSEHGLAFLTLRACYSADKTKGIGKHRYRYNPWESNVATRGRFVGYEGWVTTYNEVFQWVSAPGKNDYPYSVK